MYTKKSGFLGVFLAVAGLVATLAATPAAGAQNRVEATGSARVEASRVTKKAAKAKVRKHRVSHRSAEPVRLSRPSFGQLAGLHGTTDPLALKSNVALVFDQDADQVLFSKNSEAVLPIASITKLMTALVVTEAKQPLDEVLTITQDDVDTEKGSSSRLRVGTQLSREEMLHLALMSSENRAAHALGRHYPGGLDAFVAAMNAKAQQLGMRDTHYVEPTGLSSKNQSSARDLVVLVKAAHEVPLIRELSTSPSHRVAVGKRGMEFRTTNNLVLSPSWEIGLQKTGYISEAGRCLVMQAKLAGRQLIMVFLDSAGKYSRIADAERVRKWILHNSGAQSAAPAAEPATATTPDGLLKTSS